jgi:hypothetical protein
MLDHKLELSELFKPNSFNLVKRPSVTYDGDNSHNEDNNCYIWRLDASETLRTFLDQNSEFRAGSYSKNNYIRLTDNAFNIFENNCFTIGPNSKTRQQVVEFMSIGDNTRVIVRGWGSSYVLFWEGSTLDLLDYLKNNQKREVTID